MLKTCPIDGVSSEMVYVSKGGFCLDAHEVTNAAYQSCVEAGFCDLPTRTSLVEIPGDDDEYYGNSKFEHYPVIWVNWEQANTYCHKFAKKRLPTKSEWEKAAQNLTGERIDDLGGNVKEWLDESIGNDLKVVKEKNFTGQEFTSAPLATPARDLGFRCAAEAEFWLPWPFQ